MAKGESMNRNKAKEMLNDLLAKSEIANKHPYEEAVDIACRALSAPEIIRCIECKWWKREEKVEIDDGVYAAICEISGWPCRESGFCHRADRRICDDEM